MPRPVFDTPIAHRGLHDRAAGIIENSRTAFERAVAAGYAIECDLQLTRDGVPVVFHDATLDRLTGRRGRVIDLTADELCAIPLLGSSSADTPQRFHQLLDQVRGRVLLQVELKQQSGAATGMLAKTVADQASGYAGPIALESFDPALVALVSRFGFMGPRGIITELYDGSDEDTAHLSPSRRRFLRHLLHWPWTRFDFISASKDALDLPAIRLFRSLGKPVTVWTIRSRVEARDAQSASDQIVFEGFTPE
ncbi:Glycerophosphoryl diester phosphodiesterase [Devosia enhydra]|uniref:Glycerophosphoryl diester phosphodiesterase n=1 Tax=Devosia enhydra TaxID=665118 RepID=A0A1K2HU60_9HYPH|nr:glycerophosphodiester phosphodiesterase family protein [Devosia enhydra]SFZ81938.1 Glycerophosphoryl diester phosphodiesterase [Devosia enhydra]